MKRIANICLTFDGCTREHFFTVKVICIILQRGAETNVFEAGRSQDIEGDYEEIISGEILSWPDMLPGM